MKIFRLIIICLVAGSFFSAKAQTAEVTDFVKQSVSDLALNNILKAERIFCYTVDMPPEDYKGYTLNQMAITGFCGVLEKPEAEIFIEEFFTKEKNLSKNVADCMIKPRMVLRFFKGIDSSDVLISLPCPSLTIFYGGTLKSFNAQPSAQSLRGFLEIYENRHIDFVSPTLLDQLMPIGVAQTEEQKALVAKQNQAQPVRNWVKDEPSSAEQKDNAPKGWNKINLGKKN